MSDKQIATINVNAPVVMSVTDQAIAELKLYMNLKIIGLSDKDGYKAVYEARQVIKRTRVGVKKEADAMKETALEWQRKVNTEQNRIIEELKPIEDHLQSEEDRFNAMKEEEKRLAEVAEQAVIQQRVDLLQSVDSKVSIAFLKGITDEQFNAMFIEAARRFQEAEEARKEKAEQDAKDRAELEQLRKQKEDLEKKAAAVEAERKAQEKERYNNRAARLIAMGMEYDFKNMDFRYGALRVSADRIKTDTVDSFENAVAELKSSIDYMREEDAMQKVIDEEVARNMAIEEGRRQAEQQAAEEEAAKEEKRQQAAEKLAASSDREKFKDILDLFNGLTIHDMKSKAGKAKRDQIVKHIQAIKELCKG